VLSPQVDEKPLAGETPEALARRLAALKARAVADQFDDAVIIGSDQVGFCNGHLLHKPATAAAAITQLYAARGQTARFHTALTVIDQHRKRAYHELVTTDLVFRDLSRAEVARYVEIDEPLNCAGGFKIENLGIALFSAVSSNDPSALIGLPLIALLSILARCGINPLQNV
jgi:septum formation protein